LFRLIAKENLIHNSPVIKKCAAPNKAIVKKGQGGGQEMADMVI